jgi:four helix bundle protein
MSVQIESYRDLEAWQLGMQLAEDIYTLTRSFPREELYGLTSQLRRAAVGIPSNVAEGQQHGFDKTYLRYVSFALGCEAEVQTQLELAIRVRLATEERQTRLETRVTNGACSSRAQTQPEAAIGDQEGDRAQRAKGSRPID